MKAGTGKKSVVLLAILLLLIIISVPFQIKIDDMRGKFRSVEESLYLSSSTLKNISLGYDELLADIYWMRALQYFGSTSPEEQDPELLFHYFDIITDLDPKFVNAYRYGGTFLAEPPPYGLGDTLKGIELFEKGRKHNPNNYRLPLEEGFIYYFYPKDYEKAADLFREASEKPGVSPFRKASMKGMAAAAHAKGGNIELSKKIWEIIYETSPSEGRRNFALRNIEEIDTMAMENRLTEALREYKNTYKKIPDSPEDLVKTGIIERIPEPPVGGEFVIAPEIESIKNTELAERQTEQDLSFLNAKSARYKTRYGEYPRNMEDLRVYIQQETTGDFPAHPLGGEYILDSKTGKVTVQNRKTE